MTPVGPRHVAFAALTLWALPALAEPSPAHRGQSGQGSFYAAKDAGRPTASREPLKLDGMTAASPTLPLGTKAKVVNLRTGRAVQVRINDRGPHAKGRVLDVTPKAARAIGIDGRGTAPVRVTPVGAAPPHQPR